MFVKSVVLVLLHCACLAQAVTNDLASQLESLANDGLALRRMQEHLDTGSDFTFTTNALNGEELINQAAERMRMKYAGRTAIMQDLLQELESVYSDVSARNPYENCCGISLDEFSIALKQRVDTDKLCVAGNGLRRNPSEILPLSIVDYMKQLYVSEIGLQYIYFGSEEGIIYNYPAVDFCSDDYDPRFRPFYVETVTTQPKDVVIVIDKSGSMRSTHHGRKLMDIAIEAAQTVIDTLNANDRVGIVAFSDVATTPPGVITSSFCYSTKLAVANSENKDYLKRFVSNLNEEGSTNYRRALQKAFGYFSNSEDFQHDSNVRYNYEAYAKLILFLTDGDPTDGGSDGTVILEDIADLNRPLGNEVIIITYGLGGDIDNSALTLLQQMANQPLNDESVGDVRQGFMRPVADPSNLRSEMGTYYNFNLLLGTGEPEVTFTIPYEDAFGSGLIASICLPLRIQGQLKGVFCVDQSFGELISEISLFQIGESSYSFMVDKSTRVLQHPFMQNPTFVTNAPVFTYLDSLEVGNGVESMITEIAAGDDGDLVTSSRKVFSRGSVDLEGVDTQNHNAHYYWKKIEGTGYTIGLVIIEDDTQAVISLNPGSRAEHFFYHKIDLMQQLDNRIEACAYFRMQSVQDMGVVHFSYYAFEEPFRYLYTNETTNTIDSYRNYFIGGASNPGFKDQIKEYFTATDFFQEAMMDVDSDFIDVCVWRYIATENGILRVFPAVEIPKDWDAKKRSWYVRTKTNRDVINISPPYDDVLGPGNVITLSHVIYEGDASEAHNPSSDLVVAVMGMDFTPSYFYNMILSYVPTCQSSRCFVVDRAGFIIVHHDWIESPSFDQNIYDVHISAIEPDIAQDMTTRNILTHESCINVNEIRKQYFFRVNSETSTSYYDIIEIDGTNAFLVVKKTTIPNNAGCFSCSALEYGRCATSPIGTQCFCPCYVSNTEIYDYCKGEYDLTRDTDPICTPPLPEIDFLQVRRPPTGLQSCYDYGCEQFSEMIVCNGVIGCNWCHFYQDGVEIESPYCSESHSCPYGVVPQSHTSGEGGVHRTRQTLWWIFLCQCFMNIRQRLIHRS